MGKKGGTETSTVELPPEIREAAIQNLRMADEVGSIGYMPYSGPTVAGFSPQQMAGMQGMDQQAAAFGMPSALGAGGGAGMTSDEMYMALTGMPPPNAEAGGFRGYSAMPMYEEAISRVPGAQRAALESFVMNPYTGAAPTNRSVPAPQTQYRYNPNTGRMEAY